MILKNNIRNYSLIIFGGFVFVFFGFFYKFHLHYQEQFQLFLFTQDYVLDKLLISGGVSTFLSLFLTQFFFYPVLGAFIITASLILLQIMVLQICDCVTGNPVFYPLSYLPSILLVALLCDENYLFSGVISVLLLSIFCVIYLKLRTVQSRVLYIILGLLLAYWMIGGFYIFLSLFVIIIELRKWEKKKSLILIISAIFISTVMPFLLKLILPLYPLKQLFIGVNLHRYLQYNNFSFWVPALLTISLPFLLSFTFVRKMNNGRVLYVQLITILAFTVFFTWNNANFEKEDTMAYDYYARTRQWNKIIEMADKKEPHSPIMMSILNLALGEENLLGEKMFSYYQKGNEGLFPHYVKDFSIPVLTGEIYYHLGLVNIARRQVFEAMEVTPNSNKSARIIKRLAEISVINGNYPLAEKYLKVLNKTIFYRKWTKETSTYLYKDSLVEEHTEWGKLRQNSLKENFLISRQEHYHMLNSLLESNNQNRLAYEYLLSFYLLSKDLGNFEKSYNSGKFNYTNSIPKSYQEALALLWELTNKGQSNEMPYEIDSYVIQRLQKYSSMLNSRNQNSDNYSDTYWYYLKSTE